MVNSNKNLIQYLDDQIRSLKPENVSRHLTPEEQVRASKIQNLSNHINSAYSKKVEEKARLQEEREIANQLSHELKKYFTKDQSAEETIIRFLSRNPQAMSFLEKEHGEYVLESKNTHWFRKLFSDEAGDKANKIKEVMLKTFKAIGKHQRNEGGLNSEKIQRIKDREILKSILSSNSKELKNLFETLPLIDLKRIFDIKISPDQYNVFRFFPFEENKNYSLEELKREMLRPVEAAIFKVEAKISNIIEKELEVVSNPDLITPEVERINGSILEKFREMSRNPSFKQLIGQLKEEDLKPKYERVLDINKKIGDLAESYKQLLPRIEKAKERYPNGIPKTYYVIAQPINNLIQNLNKLEEEIEKIEKGRTISMVEGLIRALKSKMPGNTADEEAARNAAEAILKAHVARQQEEIRNLRGNLAILLVK